MLRIHPKDYGISRHAKILRVEQTFTALMEKRLANRKLTISLTIEDGGAVREALVEIRLGGRTEGRQAGFPGGVEVVRGDAAVEGSLYLVSCFI